MNRMNLIELMAAMAATAALCACASAPTPQRTADTRLGAAGELGIARKAWEQCIRTAIPRLDHPQSTSDVLSSDVLARAAMKSCSEQYTNMVRALADTLAPTCGRDADCRRGALARAQREATRAATGDVVTARVRAAGAAALQCE
ncbi:MAG: hypothetical protein ACREUT_12185 [Steroidobacteraceae bacterium]